MPVSSDVPNGHLGAEKGKEKNYLVSSCVVPFYSSTIKMQSLYFKDGKVFSHAWFLLFSC